MNRVIQAYRKTDNLVEWLRRFVNKVSDAIYPEDWREVGTTGEPAFQNSWTTTTNYHFGFRKVAESVFIHGRLTPGTETNGTLIFTLPETYRPTYPLSYLIVTDVTGAAGARLYIDTDGTVKIYEADTAGSFYDVNIHIPLT